MEKCAVARLRFCNMIAFKKVKESKSVVEFLMPTVVGMEEREDDVYTLEFQLFADFDGDDTAELLLRVDRKISPESLGRLDHIASQSFVILSKKDKERPVVIDLSKD